MGQLNELPACALQREQGTPHNPPLHEHQGDQNQYAQRRVSQLETGHAVVDGRHILGHGHCHCAALFFITAHNDQQALVQRARLIKPPLLARLQPRHTELLVP